MVQKTSAGASWGVGTIPLHPPDQATHSRASPATVSQRTPVGGRANDPREQEADRIADEVMRMQATAPTPTSHSAHVSPKVATGEEANAKPLRATQPAARELEGHIASQLRARHSAGSPLPKPRRDFFEARLGYDFTGIRIHADSHAATFAAAADARAFTLGQDIVFGAGEYAPDTGRGTRLLAHELAHVVQQQGSPASIQRQPATNDDPFAPGGVYEQLNILREGSLPLADYDTPELRQLSIPDRRAAVQTLRFQRKMAAIAKLGDLKDKRAVAALVAVVEDKLFVAPKDFEPLQKSLLQKEAVVALGKIGGPVALAKLGDLLKSKDTKERSLATGGYSVAAGGQAATDLLTALQQETDPGVKAQIISALGNIGGALSNPEKEAIVKLLIHEMENSTGDVLPRAAIDALGKIKLRTATEPLLNQLRQHLGIVQLVEDIIGALGEIGDDRAVELLVIILEKHGSASVRSEAAIALGKIGGAKASAALKSRLGQEKEDSVKAAISKALKASP